MSKTKNTPQHKHDQAHNHKHDHDHTHNHKTPSKNAQPDLIGPNQALLITLKWSEVEPTKKKVEAKLAKQLKLNGFRKGKVPPAVAKDHLNPEAIIESTLQQLIPEAFAKAIKDLKKLPIAAPEYQVQSVENGKDWTIKAVYATQPEIKLGQYKKLVKKAIKAAKKDKKATQDVVLSAIYRELALGIKPQIPELLVKRETQYEIERLASELKQHNLTLQDYIARTKLSAEQLSNEIAAGAMGRLQLTFILQKIAQEAKIEVKDEEVKKQMKDPANPRLFDYLKESLMRQKIAEHLLSLD